MEDDLDECICNLLSEPEKRSAALRIVRVGNLLKEKMLQDFWDKGKAYLTKKLADENLAYWSLDLADGSTLQSTYWIGLVGKRVDPDKPHPQFLFFQYTTATLFRWELAVKFDWGCGEYQKIRTLPEAQKLANVMDGSFSMTKKRGWDGYTLLTDDSKGIERILEEECSDGRYFGSFFEEGWKKFQGLEPYLRRLSYAVQRTAKPLLRNGR